MTFLRLCAALALLTGCAAGPEPAAPDEGSGGLGGAPQDGPVQATADDDCGDSCGGQGGAAACALDMEQGPPSVVELLRPTVGDFTGSLVTADRTGALRPTFSWRAQGTSICNPLTYELEVDDSCPLEGFADCGFETPELDEVVSEAEFTPDEDLPASAEVPVGTRYFWRVRACDVFERCSDWSVVRYLDVGRDRQDVTGDGYADIVVQHRTTSVDPYVLFAGGPELGRGPAGEALDLEATRSFGESGTSGGFSEDNPPVVRFVGDVNGDGFQDFVADGPDLDAYLPPNGLRTPEEVIFCPTRLLYLGAADVEGITQVLFSTSTWAPGGLAHNFGAGDVDADGYADLWAAQSVSFALGDASTPDHEPRVFLFRGRSDLATLPFPDDPESGTGDFTGALTPSASIQARPDDDGDLLGVSVEPGDFNGDGLVDVAVVAPRAHLVYLVVGGAVDPIVDRAIPYGGSSVGPFDCRDARLAVADFDRDGVDDFSINCPEQSLIEVYFGADPLPDAMAFSEVLGVQAPNSLLDTLAADLDGDSQADLISGGAAGDQGTSAASLWILAGSSLRTAAPASQTLPLAAAPGYFGAADHNGDGHLDLALAGSVTTWIPGDGTLDFPDASTKVASPRRLLREGDSIDSRTVGR